MKKVFSFLRDYKKECIVAPLFKCLEACFDLCVPLCMATLIDDGIRAANNQIIVKTGLLLLLLAVVGLSCSLVAQWYAAKAATGFAAKLRRATFAHIQSLSFSTADTLGTDTLITRLTSDINQAQTGVNMALRLLLRSPFIVFGAMIMAFQVDAKAAITFAVAIPLLALVVYGIMLINIPLYKRVQGHLDTIVKATRENLTGVRVIRAFNLQKKETQSFLRENASLTAANEHVGRFAALTNPLTYIIINLAAAWLIYIGAVQVQIGSLTQGQVVALLNYMAQILVELIKLANLIVTITKAIASCNRVQAVLSTQSDMPNQLSGTTPKLQGDVQFKNVSITYAKGGDAALNNISFHVSPGQTVGVIGGTGSGKSTLVNLIPRFYDATQGEVLIDGINVKNMPLDHLRGQIGSVLQKAVLFSGTIRQNIQWGKKNAGDEEVWQALTTAQAEDFVRQKPNGLDEIIEQGGKNLSVGQRQRLGIARALVRKPAILILDDSSSALDFATDAALRHAIKQLPYHPTTFIVSQRAASIMYADVILVLSDGELAGCGTHQELMENCSVYREIYQSQFKEEEETA